MNILHKLLLLLSLSMSPAVTVSAAEYTDFDTFQTAEQYLEDFAYLTENSYIIREAEYTSYQYEIDHSGERFLYYAFPIYYNVFFDSEYVFYYENGNYQFFVSSQPYEVFDLIDIINYIGSETEMPFLALDYIGISQVIEHDQEIESNSISIYNSFYNFFTGFFPSEVVAEYHGIFTFIVVGFLLFLVFGFVFFLFRVIRRLVGFK